MHLNTWLWSSGKNVLKFGLFMSIYMVADPMEIDKISQEVMYSEEEAKVGTQDLVIFKDEQGRLRRDSKRQEKNTILKNQGRNYFLFSFNYQDICVIISIFQGKEK